ncbi:hypothetical protein LX36DRAFT_661494 [Colletotrichum falcatum]|nr:hypothetical protein LX36DRAFT_661494 [Colletotrichum falcatum]
MHCNSIPSCSSQLSNPSQAAAVAARGASNAVGPTHVHRVGNPICPDDTPHTPRVPGVWAPLIPRTRRRAGRGIPVPPGPLAPTALPAKKGMGGEGGGWVGGHPLPLPRPRHG